MWSNDEMKEITAFTQSMTKEVQKSGSQSKIACCVGSNGAGGYNFRTTDGRDIADCIPLDDTRWGSGDWGTLEETGSGWVIAGECAFNGGPLPDPATP